MRAVTKPGAQLTKKKISPAPQAYLGPSSSKVHLLVFDVLVLRGDAEDFKNAKCFALVDPSGSLYYLFADR